MFNSFETIEKIFSDTTPIEELLENSEKYYAHKKENGEIETLSEHIELVQKKCVQICELHGIDEIINQLIRDFLNANFKNENKNEIGNYIKKVFAKIIVFHDYGKINENFQSDKKKMNNSNFKKVKNNLDTHHSPLGTYLFVVHHFKELINITSFSDDEKKVLRYVILSLSFSISKHHSKILSNEHKKSVSFDKLEDMKRYLEKYKLELDEDTEDKIQNTSKLFDRIHIQTKNRRENIKDNFPLYALLKLNFSLLTASDYLATGEYMNGLKLENEKDFGVLKRSEIDKIYTFLKGEDREKNKDDYNQTTYSNLGKTDFEGLTDSNSNNENLNALRQKMAIEVITKVRQNSDKNLFYIEAPTGGGKTNLSMLATMELLKANEELNKVFYVFPFTTLVTQTYKSIKKTLGLKENQIVQLHSKAGLTAKQIEEKTKEDDEKTEEDADYGKEKRNYIDNLFINFPFCLMTHIKFFDILKTNEKETNYILHRLANSVVVIDELQAYNPKHWDKLIYLIKQYAHFFNIRFIIMSATLPKLSKIKVLKDQTDNFVYLLENAKTDYFQNKNFGKRVIFNFDLLEKEELKLDELAEIVIEKSKEYAQKEFENEKSREAKPKGSVYTIVEFIFKKSATDFKGIIEKQESFFDKIFVLSGTILEHRRKEIINALKNEENRTKKILLITTQVVEAGVDIDMDLGFKNRSLIDSDEQLAGRINRNVNKENCELYLFQIDKPDILYGSDWRFQVIKDKKITEEKLKEILKDKDFDKLYNLVFEKIDLKNEDTMTVNFSNYKNHFQNLEFTNAHRNFQLIEQKNLSIFVPIPIPIKVENEKGENIDEVFSKTELDFLRKANIEPTEKHEIEGKKVFELYIVLIENRDKDFLKQKLNFKILQGVMSKFTFSLFGSSKNEDKVSEAIDNKKSKYGIYYLEHHKNIYCKEAGLDENALADMINDFI